MFVRTQRRSWRQKIRGVARIASFAAALAAILFAADHMSQRPLIALFDRGSEQQQAALGETPPAADSEETAGESAAGTTERADAPVMDRGAPGDADDETPVAEAAEPPEAGAASDGALAAPPRPSQRIVAVRRGDTLMDILLSLGISRAEAHEAVSALASVYDLRGLRPGQEITFTFAPGGPGEGQPLVGAWLAARADRDVGVARDQAGRFVPHQHDKELTLRPVRARGTVTSSLYEAGLQAGVPAAVMVEVIRIFSYDVDFQREIQPGDSFEVFFERFVDSEERNVKIGALAFASLTLSGKTHTAYRFVDRDGMADFYNEKGESLRKALLKTPIDGARLTSGFGNRMHPILGYSAFHKGVDFAAPTGTPIQAAGDGVIEQRNWNGSYGNYVRIRHSAEYATAYAHLSRFAAGLKEGARVRQGQVIGFVGSTGRSTGPHLHYEILRRGAQVNPVNVKFPTGRKLVGIDLTRFRFARTETDRTMAQAATQETARVAAAPAPR
jgi:murein DD-endopeptidase MepM/ murein hydrolase activator NlpD